MIITVLFFFIGIGFGILATVYMSKAIKLSNEQFVDYQLVCSDVRADSTEELADRLKNISDYNISDISNTADSVSFKVNKNKCMLKLQDGVVYADYKFSTVPGKPSPTKPLKVIKLSKDAQKATVINSIMDSLSGKSADKNKGIKKKLDKITKSMSLMFLASIVAFVISIFSVSSNSNNAAIENVKNTKYSDTITYGDIVDMLCPNEQKWEAFNTENDTACVEMNGKSENGKSVCIQFLGDYGVGFSNVDLAKFKITYLEIDGQKYDPDYELGLLFGNP